MNGLMGISEYCRHYKLRCDPDLWSIASSIGVEFGLHGTSMGWGYIFIYTDFNGCKYIHDTLSNAEAYLEGLICGP